jgi:serine/threonine protein kinase
MSDTHASLESLFARLIEDLEADPSLDVEAFLRDHPEHAPRLRQRLEKLRRAGLLAPGELAAPTGGPAEAEPLADRIRRRFGQESLRELGLEREDAPPAEELFQALLRRLRIKRGGFERYRIEGEVGRGGMGVVLRVWDDELKRHLAMKLMRPGEPGATPATDASTVGRFLDEAQVTAQLEHPGIVPMHELGLDETGSLYFTMRLVKGSDLGAVLALARSGAEGWNQTRALGVLLKVCEALAYAHSKGVIHRDLKPANVMVGRFGEVYLMDWGLAKVLGVEERAHAAPREASAIDDIRSERSAAATPGSPLLTRSGHALGTPAYMPPEQARGDLAAMGPHSDVYSMGAILYHALTGHAPYAESARTLEPHQVLARLLREAPARVETLAPGQPPELIAICAKAMARAPAERYPSVAELADDLRAYLEHRVVKAHRTGALVELGKWVERNRRFAAASAAALILAVSGLATTSWVEAKGRARAQGQRDSTGRVVDVFIDVFESFNQAVARGEFTSTVELMGIFRKRIEQRLARDDDTWTRTHLNTALIGLEEQLGTDTAGIFRARLDLGSLHQRQGRFEPARIEFTSVLGATDPGTELNLHAWGSLASLQQEEGDYAAAQRTNEELLRLVADRPPEDSTRLMAQENLAAVLRLRGQPAEAEAMLEYVIEVRMRTNGPNHPLTIHAQHSLGIVLLDMERPEEARTLLQDALEASERILDENVPEIARVRFNNAMRLDGMGQHAEARPLYEDALVSFERSLGEAHPDTINCLGRLGMLLVRVGEEDKGVALGERALALARGALEEKHPLRFITAVHLACGYSDLGRHEEAELLGMEALAGMVEYHGDQHPLTQELRWNLAFILGRGGHEETARKVLREILEYGREGSTVRRLAADKLKSLEPASTEGVPNAGK